MDSGSEVVMEAGEGKVKGARSAARLRLGFEYVDGDTRLSQHDRGGEAVGSCADHARFATHASPSQAVRVESRYSLDALGHSD